VIATTLDSTPVSRFERSTANPAIVDASEPSDHELMLAVRAGKIARLGDLFERHHGPLFGFFLRLTQQRALSEDLVQWVFYRILKYRHTHRDEGKFSAWTMGHPSKSKFLTPPISSPAEAGAATWW